MDMKNYQVKRFLMQKAAQNTVPVSGTFELTPLCNLSCKMCYIRMTPEEMKKKGQMHDAEEWISLGRQCVDAGMLFLLLTGGEPFLREDFFDIFHSLKSMGLIVTINSNGTMINETLAGRLIDDPPAKINITLYGSSNTTYERLCGQKSGYDKVVNAIKMLRQAGVLVNVNYSITPYNVDDMEAIFELCRELEVPVNPTAYMFPPVRNAGEGKVEDNTRLSPCMAGCARFKSEKLKYTPEQFEMRKEAVKSGLDVDIEYDECDGREPDEKMGCMAGKSSFWITWDGRMTPCGMMNVPVAYPFKDGFADSWKRINEEVNKIFLPPECKMCNNRRICGICAALAMAETGSSSKKPEYLCEMTQSYADKMNEL
ncbi:MAG: radical SAM/SPASM domain-containing protein [Eubacterium sp.]